MPSFNLATRCWLLVAVPRICQLVFLGILGCLLWDLQAETMREAASRKMISELMKISHPLLENVAMVGDSTFAGDIEQLLAEMNVNLKIFDAEPATRRQAQKVREAARIMNLEYVGSLSGGTDGASARIVMPKKLVDAILTFSDEMATLIMLEESNRSRSPARSHAKRQEISNLLVFVLACSVAATILLGYRYAVSIRKPVLRLAENSRLLSQRQSLLPVLTGNDELSALDRLLHDVSSAVSEALSREQAMIDYAADLICALDQSGQFVSANAFAETMLNLRHDEVIGRNLYELTVGGDSLAADEFVRMACSSGEVNVFELKLTNGDGKIIDTRWSAFWSSVEDQLFCVVHDITEEKRISQMKEDFVNMISHDLRSPLTSMLGSMSLIGAGALGPVSAAVGDEIASANKNIKQLVTFVNDILDFRKFGAGKVELDRTVCDLGSLIENSIELVRALAKVKNVEIKAPSGHWQVYCDGPKIVQALVNVLSNAIKFTAAGSTVTIVVNVLPSAIQTSVIDCGPGVPDEFKEKIFAAFEQAPSRTKTEQGTGLGLAIAKMIVDTHGGSIGVNDATASRGIVCGSRFWICLPTNQPDVL